MIPLLIVFLIKNLKGRLFLLGKWNSSIRLALSVIVTTSLLVISMSFATIKTPLKHVNYHVIRNNIKIGTIDVSYRSQNDSIIYFLNSRIDVKCILRFNIIGKETSIYKDDLLVYSSVFRKINDKVKTNHSVIYNNRKYHEQNTSGLSPLALNNIKQNLVTLYFYEPKGLKQVYCDYLKQIVEIEFIGNGKYKVLLSEGKYNIFHYKEGECVKIDAYSRFFDVTLIPES